uniref:THD domain-containing protein n=2 Tax=Cacopsylla melanoneura TaxID=428564 RepID=A0A8D9E3C2_9HEMI
MKDTDQSTVIKLPIGVTDTSTHVGKKIRLRNNIRLTLPPDRFHLLQNRSLCFLCILYITYTLYLHYLISCHVIQQDDTNRFFSEEINKLSRAIVLLDQRRPQQEVAESNALVRAKYVDDLKLSLRTFVESLQSFKSDEESVVDNSSNEYEDDDSSYDEDTLVKHVGQNLMKDVNLILKPQDVKFDPESKGGQERISRADKKDLDHLLKSYKDMIPITSGDQVDMLRSNQKDMSKNCTKCSKGYLPSKESIAIKSANRAIVPSEEVIIVLPRELPDERNNDLSDRQLLNELPGQSRRVRAVPSTIASEHGQGKGKKKRKHRNAVRQNSSTKTNGAEKQSRSGGRKFVSILLKGATPTASIRDGGVIRPWYMDTRANGNSNMDVSAHFVLQELSGKIQIMKAGLYMVYAQVYYTSPDQTNNKTDSINSYSITVSSPASSERAIAVCSVHSGLNYTSEVSCHLSIVYHLSIGDKLFLVQREPNRKILLKDGYSYFGISTLRVDS